MRKSLSKWWHLVKKLFEEEIFDIIISIIISFILEICRKTVKLFLSTENGPVNISRLQDLRCNETYDDVLNIILLTLIIWGVTGLSKMMKNSNPGKKNKVHTSSMIIVFIISFLWYILKYLFVIDQVTMMVSGILCVSLFFILCSYFVKNKTIEITVYEYQSDHRVA